MNNCIIEYQGKIIVVQVIQVSLGKSSCVRIADVRVALLVTGILVTGLLVTGQSSLGLETMFRVKAIGNRTGVVPLMRLLVLVPG